MTVRLGRRSLLQLGLGAVASLPFALSAGCTNSARTLRQDPRLAVALRRASLRIDRKTAAAVGAPYLDDVVADHDPVKVHTLLEPILELLASAPSDSEAGERVRARIRADFLENQVHELRGWSLARTELGLSLLVFLGS